MVKKKNVTTTRHFTVRCKTASRLKWQSSVDKNQYVAITKQYTIRYKTAPFWW